MAILGYSIISYRVASFDPNLAPQRHKGLSMIAGNLAGP